MCNRIIPLLVALQCAAAVTLSASAQQAMETVTKTVTQEVTLSPGDVFRVAVEKATVRVTGWDKNYVQARIVFSASHPDRKVAAHEVGIMQYSLSREERVVEFRNAFILPANTDVIRSKLEVSVELMMPEAVSLKVETKYSNTRIQGMRGVTSTDLEFSDLDLERMAGSFTLKATFSEIRGEAVGVSSFKSQDSRSQFSLDVTGGTYVFQSRYSKIDLTVKQVKSLTIDAARTDIVVRTDDIKAYGYELSNRSGRVSVSATYGGYLTPDAYNTLRSPADPSKPLIRISTTFDNITIK